MSNNKACDDAAFTTWPGAPDTAGDGVDQDCTGADAPAVDEDDTVDPKGCATAPWAGLAAAAALTRRRRRRTQPSHG